MILRSIIINNALRLTTSHYANDTNTLYSYLDTLLNRGMTKKELNYFINKRPSDKRLKQMSNNYLEYHQAYLDRIDYSLEEKFRTLDFNNQIDIQYAKKYYSKKQRSQYRKKQDSLRVNQYVQIVNKYSFPTESKIGIGSRIALNYSNTTPVLEGFIMEYIDSPDLTNFWHDSVFMMYSYHPRNLTYNFVRRGNSLLWHIHISEFPKLDSIIKKAITEYEFSPYFYAAIEERFEKLDCALAMGSATARKYHFDLKKIIQCSEHDKINNNRVKLKIRTLENDLALFQALQSLEKLRYKDYFRSMTKGKSLFFFSLFTTKIP